MFSVPHGTFAFCIIRFRLLPSFRDVPLVARVPDKAMLGWSASADALGLGYELHRLLGWDLRLSLGGGHYTGRAGTEPGLSSC
jgi:hypothetical protein